jgi:O-antigen ligase
VSREAIPALGVFALVAALGFDDGGYAATAWGWSGVALLVALVVLIARGARLPEKAGVVYVGALAGLVAWTAASLLWSSHFSASMLEVERTLMYVVAAGVFVLAGSGPALLAGVLGAATMLCGYGLVDVQAGERLAEPLGYANGMAITAVIGLLLAVGFAARASGRTATQLAAAPAPLLAATLYLTFGRGAWLALAVGLAVAVAVGPGRLQHATTAVGLAIPAALAVLAADRLGPTTSLAVLLAGLCLASAFVPFALRAVPFKPSERARTAFAALLIVLPAVLAAALLVKLGGPSGAYDAFKAAPQPTHGDTSARVFSLSGRNRSDYWSVAWRSYEDEPLLGAGAGTFARTWLRERPVPQPVTDAHSLYLETLAELGPVGLVLLLLALAAPFAVARTRWTPVAIAPYAAFLAHAAQDWDWELPAVTVAALACGTAPIAGQAGPRLPRFAAVVPAALCLVLAFAFAGNHALERSIDAMDGLRWAEAEESARRARTLQPWSPEPWRVLGEIELAEGSLAVARRHFRRGLQKDPDEFELWIGLGLASEGAAQQRAFARAARLNPLSPDLRELGFETGSGG